MLALKACGGVEV